MITILKRAKETPYIRKEYLIGIKGSSLEFEEMRVNIRDCCPYGSTERSDLKAERMDLAMRKAYARRETHHLADLPRRTQCP